MSSKPIPLSPPGRRSGFGVIASPAATSAIASATMINPGFAVADFRNISEQLQMPRVLFHEHPRRAQDRERDDADDRGRHNQHRITHLPAEQQDYTGHRDQSRQ